MVGERDEAEGRLRRRRRRRRIGYGVAAAFAVLAPLWVMAAMDDTDNIALARNEVVRAPGGGRMWRGTFWNHTDSLYTGLSAVVLFLDAEGRPVGQARGAARRLDPGEAFGLEAALPADAARMQVCQLRWTTGPADAGTDPHVLGPYEPWEFGHVTDRACGDVRLAIGSCTPLREVRD